MIEIIKKAGLGAVEASKPVAVLFGTVLQTDPLQVRVDQRFTLPEDFLVVPERLTEYKTVVNGQEVVIREKLKPGDTVLLLRMQGGQQFVVLDRVVG